MCCPFGHGPHLPASRHAHYSYTLPPEFPPGGQEYRHSEDYYHAEGRTVPSTLLPQRRHRRGHLRHASAAPKAGPRFVQQVIGLDTRHSEPRRDEERRCGAAGPPFCTPPCDPRHLSRGPPHDTHMFSIVAATMYPGAPPSFTFARECRRFQAKANMCIDRGG